MVSQGPRPHGQTLPTNRRTRSHRRRSLAHPRRGMSSKATMRIHQVTPWLHSRHSWTISRNRASLSSPWAAFSALSIMPASSRNVRVNGPSSPPAWGSFFCLVIGVFLGIAGLLLFANTLTFVRSAASAPGKVVELKQQIGQGNTYAPRVRFTTVDGRQVEFVSSVYSSLPFSMWVSK
jgi:hypothetical protein